MFPTAKVSTCLLLALILTASACGGGDSTTGPGGGSQNPPPSGSIAGAFALATHNGDQLPAHAWHDEPTEGVVADMYVMAGSILLRSDSTYQRSAAARLVIQGVSDETQTAITDGSFSFAPYEPGAVEGSLTFHPEQGNQHTCELTRFSITCQTTMPGPLGQGDIPVVLVWVRE